MEFNRVKLKKFGREIILPVLFLIIYIFIFYFQTSIQFPSQDSLLKLILNFVNNQSLILIFLIALIEGGFVLGQYAPGGVVIFLSIIAAGSNIPKVIALIIIISIAFIIAYSFDYLIGYYGVNTLVRKFGFSKLIEKTQKILLKNEFKAIFFSYWDSNLASITAAASGFARIPFKRFLSYSVISTFFWNTVWAILLVSFGNIILNFFGKDYLLIIIFLWVLYIFYNNFIEKEEKTGNVNL